MLYALLRNPPYLARLVAEIDSINDVPNNEVLSRLPLLDNAISETLRLYPSVPINLTENTTQSPSVLPDGTVVEPQEHVVFSPWVMARLPEVYGEDASEFRPERWTEMKHKPTAWELPIFHAGPRSCLGQTMAKMEMGIVLKEILKNYEFEMGWDGGERFMGEGITHPMQDGLPVWVRRRVKV
jgi:cytochrome P450